MSTQRNLAIDAMKGLAIMCVMVLHTVPRQFLYDSWAVFHIWQAVPVFIVLMGFTGVRSRVTPLKEYARRRASRLVPALAITWLVSLIFALGQGDQWLRSGLLLGAMPTSGPGNYFIGVLIQFTLLLPVLRALHDRSPRLLLGVALAANVAFELVAWTTDMPLAFYSYSVLRYLVAIALGMLLADGWKSWAPAPLSAGYLAALTTGWAAPLLLEPWQSQSFLAAAYPVGLVALGLRYLRNAPKWLTELGRASLHIFLVQILWFGQVIDRLAGVFPPSTPLLVAFNVVMCCVIGYAFYALERSVRLRLATPGSTP